MLKWSTKISNACLEDEEKILAAMRKMNAAANNSANAFAKMQPAFDTEAKKDFAKWDCEAMYPKPIQHKVDPMELITGALKEGMNIFN